MSHARRLSIYAAAAVIAIVVNIGSQWLIELLFGDSTRIVYFSILFGTSAGLVAKYLMDKIFVFEETLEAEGVAKQFMLYSLTGVFTTLIFWGVEIVFHYAFESAYMRYVGGVIGLTIGYVLKYIVDSKFVFGPSRAVSEELGLERGVPDP